MKPSEAMAKIETLQELIEPVATTTTDRIIRELWGYFWAKENTDGVKKELAQRASETPANK
jgi:hypothetical protein